VPVAGQIVCPIAGTTALPFAPEHAFDLVDNFSRAGRAPVGELVGPDQQEPRQIADAVVAGAGWARGGEQVFAGGVCHPQKITQPSIAGIRGRQLIC